MRIGQLARRLGIPPTEISGYLGAQNIHTEAGANSRLSSELLVKVITHFAPEKLSEIMAAPVEEPVVEKVEVAEVILETPIVEEVIVESVIAEQPQVDATPELPAEVIRVPKVELQGLKVLGKIDLPEPKKKEVVQPAEEQPLQQPSRPRREFQKRTNERREWKNPLEVKRQEEARRAEEKKKEQAERQKEKRASHYYNKVKSVPTKAVRRIEEDVVVEDVETKTPPKGLFGKFLRWLRT